MTGPKGNIEIPRKNSLFPSGPVNKCQIYKYNSLDRVKKSPKNSRQGREKKTIVMNWFFQQNGFTCISGFNWILSIALLTLFYIRSA